MFFRCWRGNVVGHVKDDARQGWKSGKQMWIAKRTEKKRNFKIPSRKKVLSKNSFVYWNFVFHVIFSKHNRTQSRSVLVHISLIWLISWVEGSQLCVHVRFLVERILLLHFFFFSFQSLALPSDLKVKSLWNSTTTTRIFLIIRWWMNLRHIALKLLAELFSLAGHGQTSPSSRTVKMKFLKMLFSNPYHSFAALYFKHKWTENW